MDSHILPDIDSHIFINRLLLSSYMRMHETLNLSRIVKRDISRLADFYDHHPTRRGLVSPEDTSLWTLPGYMYHQVIKKAISVEFPDDPKVLDLGCGTGYPSMLFSTMGLCLMASIGMQKCWDMQDR